MSDTRLSALNQKLVDGLNGRVVGPADADYDTLRVVFPGGVDRRPALIVLPRNSADVQHTVRAVRAAGVPLAVRSGGHTLHSSVDGGVVLDLREMTAIDIDAAGRTAWAETGLSAAKFGAAAGAHGLAVGFGDTGSVGIGGITLGGGIGYLVRKHGMTIDNLLAADIVTADGEIRRVSAESNPDLFWAIRGGGGNFGIATRFQYRLQPVDQVVGGMLILPATPETIEGFIALSQAAPPEMSTIANVMSAPPMPFLPEHVHGKLIVLGLMCYAGDPADGERAFAPFRALATPLADMIKTMSYPELFPPDQEEYHPTAVGKTMFMNHVDRGVAETILNFLGVSDAPMRVVQLRVLGGAMAKVDPDATAFAHRRHPLMANVAAFYNGAEDRPKREAWVNALASSLDQGASGAYVNFLNNEGEERVRAAYPGPTFERLRAIKRKYDPENFFRLNENVAP